MSKDPYACLTRKNGKYYVIIYYYVDGKRKSKSRPTGIPADAPNQRKAKQQEREALAVKDQLLGEFLAADDLSEELFTATAKTWLERQEGQKSQSTLASYANIVRDICIYFGEVKPIKTMDMTSVDVEDYLAWERRRRQPGYSGQYAVRPMRPDGSGIENTVKHRATAVRSILQGAKRAGLVDRNVASTRDSDVELPKVHTHTFDVLSQDEAVAMVQALQEEESWFRVAVLLGLICGLRRSEVIGLKTSDIDLTRNTMAIQHAVTQQTRGGKNTVTIKPRTKNNTSRTLAITPELSPYIETLLKDNQKYEREFGREYDQTWRGHIMRYPDGRLVTPNALTNRYNRFLRERGFKKIRFHDLRHSCASIMVANGESLQTIQEVLGHTQLTTTIMYTHQYGYEKDKAVNLMSSCILGKMSNPEGKEQIDGKADGNSQES